MVKTLYRVTLNGAFIGVIHGKRELKNCIKGHVLNGEQIKTTDSRLKLEKVKQSKKTEYTVFDSYDVYSEENRECAKETLELNEREITEENILEECNFMNEIWFEDEQRELDRVDEGASIIAIADVGRWDGRVTGYKEIKKLSDILYSSCDYERVYVNSNGDLRKEESHHDGSNSILYRYVKDGADLERLEDKIYNGECTQRDITRYTRKAGLGIARAYGWKVRGA